MITGHRASVERTMIFMINSKLTTLIFNVYSRYERDVLGEATSAYSKCFDSNLARHNYVLISVTYS